MSYGQKQIHITTNTRAPKKKHNHTAKALLRMYNTSAPSREEKGQSERLLKGKRRTIPGKHLTFNIKTSIGNCIVKYVRH